MFKNILFVACGGAVGATLRYLITFIPMNCIFPLKTMLTNIIGSLVIGLVVGLAENRSDMPGGLIIFLKTGICGGFTTFSTFSLETLELIDGRHYMEGTFYMALSVISCVAGVAVGRFIGTKVWR